MNSSPTKIIKPRKAGQMHVNKSMLDHSTRKVEYKLTSLRLDVRADLKKVDERFIALQTEMDSRFKKVDAKIDNLKTEMDLRFKKVDSRFDQLELRLLSGFDQLKAIVHGIALKIDEQEIRNKYVLDGYALLSARMDRLEGKV